MQKYCKKSLRAWTAVLAIALATVGCTEDGGGDDPNEIISRVELTFTPTAGGDPLVFQFDDPDGDGGVSGTSDRIELAAGVEYTLAVRFLNEIASPPEDLTEEIRAEAEHHFVFVIGDVSGPASSSANPLAITAYADKESDYGPNAVGDDLPVGLVNTFTTQSAGSGQLRVLLRHLPPINDQPQKTGDLPQQLAAGDALPGSVDADVAFELVVS